jgi:hypothetical protein
MHIAEEGVQFFPYDGFKAGNNGNANNHYGYAEAGSAYGHLYNKRGKGPLLAGKKTGRYEKWEVHNQFKSNQ